jgi:Ethanolamine utilization protein EutJ (predicted chaperonin)
MAEGDCPVEMHDPSGAVSGYLTIKNGKSVSIGGNTTLHCKNGNVTVTATNATTGGTTTGGVVKHPVIVYGPAGLSLKK